MKPQFMDERFLSRMLRAIAASALVSMAACTTPGLQGVLPYQSEVHQANQSIASARLPAPRHVPPNEWQATLDRVVAKLQPALRETCQLTQAANCWASTDTRRISLVHDATINAFVDADHQIGMHSGLIQQASSDNEIAAVLAHEFGHIFAGHHNRVAQNEGQGLLAGALVGVMIASETGVNQTGEWASLGQSVGAAAYSQQYELEADYYSALILSNAGVDLGEGRNLLLRLARTSRGNRDGWGQQAMLMANTHPSNDYRMARWAGIARSIDEAKSVSPAGNEVELRLHALNKLFAGNNGFVRVGDMARWINPRTGASGMMTLAEIKELSQCGRTCVRYSQTDYQQGSSGAEIRYACWKPGRQTEYHSTSKPWGFFGGADTACPPTQ